MNIDRLLLRIKSKGRQSIHGEGLLSQHQPLLLHPAVLKPDLHLLVAQFQSVRQLLPLLSVDELVHHELILELRQLWLGIRLPLLSGFRL